MAKIFRKFILMMVILFTSSCQFQLLETKEAPFPTPLNRTEEANVAIPTLTAIIFPTATIIENLSKEIETGSPSPSATLSITTQIFPQGTIPIQTNYHKLEENIDQIISQSGGRWHIVLKEVDGPTIYERLPEQRIHIASVVKVPLALLFFAALEENGIHDNRLTEYIQSRGTGGRTFNQLLDAMLVKSEEDATDILAGYIGESLNIPVQMREWELSSIDLNSRRYTAMGVSSLFERLYKGDFVSPTSQKLILDYLSAYTPNDDIRIGILRNRVPESYQIYNKRGSLLTPYVVADSAILENPSGKDYVITIFAYNSDPKTTYERLDQAIGEIAVAFWDYISTDE